MKINYVINGSPKGFDIAFSSINQNGGSGNLNRFVLESLGLEISNLPEAEKLKSGVVQITHPRVSTNIIYIVTVGRENSDSLLKRNFETALNAFRKNWTDKRIWIPLMGVGAGRLNFHLSFDIIFECLSKIITREYSPKEIAISIPSEVSAQDRKHIQNKLSNFNNLFVQGSFSRATSIDAKRIVELDPNFVTEGIPDLVENAIRKFQDINSQIFVGGHTWSSENLLETFIKEKRWENGHDDRNTQAVNSARIGDVVLMKSTFAQGGKGYLRIKAIGIISNNHEDGHNLDLTWIQFGDYINVPDLGQLRNTFQLLREKYYPILFRELIKRNPLLVEEIIRYILKVRSEKFGKSGSSDEKNQPKVDQGGGGTGGDGNNPPPMDEPPIEPELPNYEDDDSMRIASISNDFGKKDSLDFEKDVRAFAALIAYTEMKPPLAIVLFGKWGSGKSFFMNQLELRIRELSIFQRFDVSDGSHYFALSTFHKGIAHIRFNAWSYMDANLWAGFAHSLFEKLNEYITQNTKGNLERLKVSVKISKRLEKIQGIKKELENNKIRFEKLKKELEEERDSRILKIFSKRYDGPIRNYLIKCGYEEDEINLMTPSKVQERIRSVIKFIAYAKTNAIEFISFGITAILIWLFSKSLLFEHFFDGVNWLKDQTVTYFIMAAAVCLPYCRFFFKKKRALARVATLVEELRNNRVETDTNAEIDRLFTEIADIEKLIAELDKSEKEEEIKNSNLTQTAIEEFIGRQADSEDYKKHLGIITTIRKDFETLSDLFAIREFENHSLYSKKEINAEEDLLQDRNIIAESFETGKKLERIVLYIDDLDRCSDEKVIEVLEAVHLLMAFPLFTVVVGVDERSVNNALIMRQVNRYKNIHKDILDDKIRPKIKEIQPIEYLEKIFQIPFQLPSASPVATKRLLEDIIGDVVTENGPREQIDSSTQSNQSEDTKTGDNVKRIRVDTTEQSNSSEEPEVEFTEENIAEPFRPEMIQITAFERNYIEKCSVLVGTNPRTIKRYVNIYRICKVHEFSRMREKQTQVEIIFLLALFIGEYREAGIKLFKTKTEDTIMRYFESDDFKDLHPSLFNWNKQDDYLREMLLKKCDDLKYPLKFIKRFSYNAEF